MSRPLNMPTCAQCEQVMRDPAAAGSKSSITVSFTVETAGGPGAPPIARQICSRCWRDELAPNQPPPARGRRR